MDWTNIYLIFLILPLLILSILFIINAITPQFLFKHFLKTLKKCIKMSNKRLRIKLTVFPVLLERS